jgi:hypothetical protein
MGVTGSPWPTGCNMSVPYICSKCLRGGCKLWRDYQTFLENLELFCVVCAAESQNKNIDDIDKDGRRSLGEGMMGRTDQIGWLVPAVPTPDGETFWGYSSVPEDGVKWWREQPTFPPPLE